MAKWLVNGATNWDEPPSRFTIGVSYGYKMDGVEFPPSLLLAVVPVEKFAHFFRFHTVDASEIPNNHLGCIKPCK